MICHECARDAAERPAVAVCRFCMVGLCKQHLVELYRDARTFPQLTCHHQPGAPFEAGRAMGSRCSCTESRRVSSGQRTRVQLAPAPGI